MGRSNLNILIHNELQLIKIDCFGLRPRNDKFFYYAEALFLHSIHLIISHFYGFSIHNKTGLKEQGRCIKDTSSSDLDALWKEIGEGRIEK